MFDDAKPDDKINMTVGEFVKAITDTRHDAYEEVAKFVEGLVSVALTDSLHGARADVAARIRGKFIR